MKHVPITQKAKTRFTFKDNMDISMNADGTGGAFKSPNKNLEKVAEQLEGAVKAHGNQAKAIRKHIKEMKSPAKNVEDMTKSQYEKAKKTSAERRKAKGLEPINISYEERGKKPAIDKAVNKATTKQKATAKAKADKAIKAKYPKDSPAKRKDACYSKVKSRYKKWPSAYASGALAKCRKVGAANWGNKSKK